MDPHPPSYSLDQLLAQASNQLGEDLNPRTIRLYATEGLIDRPGRDGRHAVYGERQLRQLLLIRSLAQRGLSLAAIAPLAAASDDDIDAQLADLLPDAPAAMAAAMSAPLIEENKALAYLQELPATSSLSRSPSRRRLSSIPTASSHWQRFELAPGVELHLSEDAAIPPSGPRRQRWLQCPPTIKPHKFDFSSLAHAQQGSVFMCPIKLFESLRPVNANVCQSLGHL